MMLSFKVRIECFEVLLHILYHVVHYLITNFVCFYQEKGCVQF